MTISKPMLAATVLGTELEKLEWPLLGSPKLDGIRCLNHATLGPVTRSFKSVPNVHIRDVLRELLGDLELDGELLGIDKDGKVLDFNQTQSAVMSRGGQPDFVYAVFDCYETPELSFTERLTDAELRVAVFMSKHVESVPHVILKDVEEFKTYAEENIEAGYEGTMLRDPNGPYKSGRSTLKQQWLVKYKEWADAEGTITGFEELLHNSNEDIKDNFGHAKRTSHKANMVPTGRLGALILDTEWGELRVGTGFDDALRTLLWARNMISPTGRVYREPGHWVQFDLGRKITFRYQPFGMQGLPRFPSFKGFREDE